MIAINSYNNLEVGILMQSLASAKQLAAKAENFITEGNYEYAATCYDKIIHLLREALLQAQSKDSV